ncbi:MAG: RibD family protein [Solirubrobacterales bacterium]
MGAPLRRLLPEPGDTTVQEEIDSLDFVSGAAEERPYLVTNFALTVDGRATISGRSGAIGTETDTAMLVGLRTRVDAVMIGAGTMRVERYGRIVNDPDKRAQRERDGLPHDPLMVLVSARLDLPWDAELFTCGAGRVLVFTASEAEPPETATSVIVERHVGAVDLVEAMRYLRQECGIRGLLCEGGPHLHAGLLAKGLVDELFVTRAAKLAGGSGPGLAEGMPANVRELELAWLLADGAELFARYRVQPS